VITGEGFLDEQSFRGKVVGGMQAIARRAAKPIVAIVGDAEPDVAERIEHVALVGAFGRERAMQETRTCIEEAATILLSRRAS
jgi:glycerate kinase